MGVINPQFSGKAEDPTATSLGEALLLTTMSIIGLPVQVHVKDGSIYSGIFHTASFEKGYGIVLKKAMMTKKGKQIANIKQGGLIETLVILSGDLVQVVAKGLPSQAKDTLNVDGNNLEAVGGTIPPLETLKSEAKAENINLFAPKEKKSNQKRNVSQNGDPCSGLTSTTCEDNSFPKVDKDFGKKNMSLNDKSVPLEVEKGNRGDSGIKLAQVGDGKSQVERDCYRQQFEIDEKSRKLQGQSPSIDSDIQHAKPIDKIPETIVPKVMKSGLSCIDVTPLVQRGNLPASAEVPLPPLSATSSCSTNSFPSVVDLAPKPCHSSTASSEGLSSQSSVLYKNAKEFKLNPGAKVFSPSFANPSPATTSAVPAIATVAYLPNSPPLLSVDAAQTETAFNSFTSRSSLPAKFVPHGNMMGGNGVIASQYNQSIMGYPGNRMQSARYAGQYHSVQTGPAQVPSNPQAVVVGRLGQILYVHPAVQETLQSAASISPLSARPLFVSHQVQFPKQQGHVGAGPHPTQLYVSPTFAANGQQPFAVANHIPLLQPSFPANHPMAVPGSNSLLSSKFP